MKAICKSVARGRLGFELMRESRRIKFKLGGNALAEVGSISWPFDTESVCRAFNYSGFQAGVIKGNSGCYGSMLNYNITCFFPFHKLADDRSPFFCVPEINWPLLSRHQEILCHEIDSEIYGEDCDAVSVILECLKEGYIYMKVDLYYIPGTQFYLVSHIVHDVLIVGWNSLNAEISLCAGFDHKGEYVLGTVGWVMLSLSIRSAADRRGDVEAMRKSTYSIRYIKNRCEESKVDLRLVRSQLADSFKGTYSACEYIADGWRPDFRTTRSNGLFGVRVYEILSVYFEHKVYNKDVIDLRVGRALWEHKALMLERLISCSRIGLNVRKQVISLYKELCDSAWCMHVELVKRHMEGCLTSPDSLQNGNIEKLQAKETEALRIVLEDNPL